MQPWEFLNHARHFSNDSPYGFGRSSLHSDSAQPEGNFPSGGIKSVEPFSAGVPRLKRILVVDDVHAMRVLMDRTLRSFGYQVTVCRSAAHALEELNTEAYDVLLTDLNMPDMSGLDLARTCRMTWPEMSIIVFSAMVSDPIRGGSEYPGVDLLLSKPIRLNTLKTALNRLLSGVYRDTGM